MCSDWFSHLQPVYIERFPDSENSPLFNVLRVPFRTIFRTAFPKESGSLKTVGTANVILRVGRLFIRDSIESLMLKSKGMTA